MGKTSTVQVAALACRAAQECERQTQCKSLHWLVERRKSGKDKHSASLCIGLSSGARVGKTSTVHVSALACRAAQECERQTQCKSLHWLVERNKSGQDKHSASPCIGLSSGARVGKANTVQVSAALACRAAQEWERQTQYKSLQHWLVERRKSGKDKHSASLCSIGLSSGERMGKTNTMQVSVLACRAAQEWERQTQCKSLHWLVERRKNGKDIHSANLCISLPIGARMGKTNTVQVSAALACRAAQELERQTQCKSLH